MLCPNVQLQSSGSNLVGGDECVDGSFFKDDIPVINNGGFAGLVSIGHDGHPGNHRWLFTKDFLVVFIEIWFFI